MSSENNPIYYSRHELCLGSASKSSSFLYMPPNILVARASWRSLSFNRRRLEDRRVFAALSISAAWRSVPEETVSFSLFLSTTSTRDVRDHLQPIAKGRVHLAQRSLWFCRHPKTDFPTAITCLWPFRTGQVRFTQRPIAGTASPGHVSAAAIHRADYVFPSARPIDADPCDPTKPGWNSR